MGKFIDPWASPEADAGETDSAFVDPWSSKDEAVQGGGLSDVDKPNAPINPVFARKAKELHEKRQREAEGDSGFWEDMARMFASGAVAGAEGDVEVVDYLTGGNKATQFTSQKLTEVQDELQEGLTPETKEALSKKFLVENEDGEIQIGEAMSDFRAWAGTVSSGAGSLATMVMTGGPLKWLVKKGLRKSLKKQVEKQVAKKKGKDEAEKIVADKFESISGIVGYGAAEAGMVAGITGKQIEKSIMEMPADVLNSSAIFAETKDQISEALPNTSEERIDRLARQTVARQMAIEGAKDIAIPSFLLGSFAGHYIDRALRGRLGSSRLRGAGKATLTEAPTEALQGGAEQYVQNTQVGKIDPSVQPTDDVPHSMFAEGVGGAGAGAMLGALSTPEAPQPKQDETQPTTNPEVPPMPESEDTLRAQIKAVTEGRKPAMLFTPGETVPDDLPEDLAAFDLGKKVGIFVYPRENRAILQQAKKEVMQTGTVSGHTLGYGNEGKTESDQVITVRDESGTVIHDVIYGGSEEERAAAERTAGENGSIEIRPLDDALAERKQAIPETRQEAFERVRQEFRDGSLSWVELQEEVTRLMAPVVPETREEPGFEDTQKIPEEELPKPAAETEAETPEATTEHPETPDQEGEAEYELSDRWTEYEPNEDNVIAYIDVDDETYHEFDSKGGIAAEDDGTFTGWAFDGTEEVGNYPTLGEAGAAVEEYLADKGVEAPAPAEPETPEPEGPAEPEPEAPVETEPEEPEDEAPPSIDDIEAMFNEEAGEEEPEGQTQEDIDAAANEAATSPENDRKEPTEGEKEGGNYKLGEPTKLKGGITFRSENPKGSYRFKVDRDAIKAFIDSVHENPIPGRPEYDDARRVFNLVSEANNKLDSNKTVPEAFEALEEAHKVAKESGLSFEETLDAFMLPEDERSGKPYWYHMMPWHYGKVMGVKGADGDELDIFVGPIADDPKDIYIIDQVDQNGIFDEHKVMYGFENRMAARKGYLDAYDEGWTGLGAITKMSLEEFSEWVNGDLTKPVSDDLVSPEPETDTQPEPESQGETEEERFARIRKEKEEFFENDLKPKLEAFFSAVNELTPERLERNKIKTEGVSVTDWLMEVAKQTSTWDGQRKTGNTGIQMLSKKDLWTKEGEKLRKAMLAAVKSLKASPGYSVDQIRELETPTSKGEPLIHGDMEPWQMTKFEWQQQRLELMGVNWATMLWSRQTQGRPEDLPTPDTGDLYGVKAPPHADSGYRVALPNGPTTIYEYRGIGGYDADNKNRVNGWEDVTSYVFDMPAHKEAVKKALEEGKDVPDNVLSEYPDLSRTELTPPEPEGETELDRFRADTQERLDRIREETDMDALLKIYDEHSVEYAEKPEGADYGEGLMELESAIQERIGKLIEGTSNLDDLASLENQYDEVFSGENAFSWYQSAKQAFKSRRKDLTPETEPEKPKEYGPADVFYDIARTATTRSARESKMNAKYGDFRADRVQKMTEAANLPLKRGKAKLSKTGLIRQLLDWYEQNIETYAPRPPSNIPAFGIEPSVDAEGVAVTTSTPESLTQDAIRSLNDIVDLFEGGRFKKLDDWNSGFVFDTEASAKAFLSYITDPDAEKKRQSVIDRVKARVIVELTDFLLKNDQMLDLAAIGDKPTFKVDAIELIHDEIANRAAKAEADVTDAFSLEAIEALVGDGPGDLNTDVFSDEYFDNVFDLAKDDAKARDKSKNRENRQSLIERGDEELAARLASENPPEEAGSYSNGWKHAISGGTMSNLANRGDQQTRIGYQDAQEWMKENKLSTKGKKQGSTGTPLRRAMDGIEKAKGGAHAELKEILRLTSKAELMQVDYLPENATEGMKYLLDLYRQQLKSFTEWFGSREGGGHGKYSAMTLSEAVSEAYDRNPDYVKEEAKKYLASIDAVVGLFDGSESAEQVAKRAEDEFYKFSDDHPNPYKNDKSWTSLWSNPKSDKGLLVNQIKRNSLAIFSYSFLKGTKPYFFKDESIKYDPNANRKTPLRRPRLDHVNRVGLKDPRGNKNITPKQLKETFGFTDITIGKGVTAKQEQDHLNYAYDSLMSLSETLGIDPINISLGGWLHFSIGALGHGRYAAHFQPAHPKDPANPNKGTVPVINLTKTNGDGAVAHEWWHAFDERLAQNSGTGLGGSSKLVDFLYDRLQYRYRTMEELKDWVKEFLDGYRYWKNMKRDLPTNLDKALFAIKEATWGYKAVKTQYKLRSDDLDKGRGRDKYWGTPKELFARAGEAFVYDLMSENSAMDDYLVNDWVEDGKVSKENGYKGTPYPTSDERSTFNSLFREMLDSAIEWTDNGPRIKSDWIAPPKRDRSIDEIKAELTAWAKKYDADRKEEESRNVQDLKSGWMGGTDLARELYYKLADGTAPKDNRELRDFVSKFDSSIDHLFGADSSNKRVDDARLKEAQEDFEVAIAQRARFLVRQAVDAANEMHLKGDDKAKAVDDIAYNALYRLYQKQPNLNIQTTTSAKNQAYSTPAPMAYLATRLTGAMYGESSTFYEPTSGNGMLLINVKVRSQITANEIDPRRAESTNAQGIITSTEDATKENDLLKRSKGHVFANPPFGALKAPVRYEGYKITQIDQLIALRALEAMRSNGNAVLILGASKIPGEMSTGDRVFFNYLYSHYNVTEHFEASGDLYKRQGAGWPVRVIVISGRQESDKVAPKKGTIKRVENYAELYEHYQRVQYGNVVSSLAGATGEEAGDGGSAQEGSQDGQLPGSPSEPDAASDRQGAEGGSSGSDRESTGRRGSGDESGRDGLGSGDNATAAGQGSDQSGTGEPEGGVDTGEGASGEGVSGERSGDDTGPDVVPPSADDIEKLFDEVASEQTEKQTEPTTPEKPREAIDVPGHGWMTPMTASSEQEDAILVEGYGYMVPVEKIGSKKAKKDDDPWADLDDIANDPDVLFSRQPVRREDGTIDETYAKVKPVLYRALQDAIDTGKRLKDAMRDVIKTAIARFGAKIKPYVMRFYTEITDAIERGVLDNNGRPVKDSGSDLQTHYIPESRSGGIETLTPTNQARAVRQALKHLTQTYGSVDEFVRSELQYKTVDELHDAMMGHQVDGVALAIHQLKSGKALIIGDQTGVGKGRQAAAIIHWAKLNNYTPIFVTAKPALYTDMYRDMIDIGVEYKPLLTNAAKSAAVTIEDENGNKKRLFANTPAQLRKDNETILKTEELPKDRDVLFTTYDQLKPSGDNRPDNPRWDLVASLAPNAVFILDESHNAAGASGTGEFMRGVLETAGRAVYLSATYAKRPDNIPVYFLTDLSMAADSITDLIDAMDMGGTPLMEIVSSQLTKSGQFIRREMSFEGISIPTRYFEEMRDYEREVADEVTERLRAIVMADRAFHGNMDFIEDNIEEIGGSIIDTISNFADASVSHTHFTAVVHNAVSQMILAIKAKQTAQLAIDAIKRGERPVIALDKTMGSFLEDYKTTRNLKKGDTLEDFDYRVVLGRMLRRTRRVKIVDDLGNEEHVEIPLDMLLPEVRARYELAEEMIQNMRSSLSASPIDLIRKLIEDAGYSVKEVTGRSDRVDYSTDPPTYASISSIEKKDRVATVAEFNDGELDVIIMNVAGATGISMQASPVFKNQDPRHMIVAEPALDINIFVQMLGRINRNGQIELPMYTIYSTNMPSEKRPIAVLSGKLKKLNANTSSNETSATSVEAVDLMNKYGDLVVAQFLNENPEFRDFIDVDFDLTSDPPDVAGTAKRATGQVALLAFDMQEEFYNRVEAEYKAYINYLNETNRNDLAAKDIDFKARPISQQKLYAGDDQTNPFTSDANLTLFSVIKQGFPPTASEVKKELKATLGDDLEYENLLDSDVQGRIKEFTEGLIAPAMEYIETKLYPAQDEKIKTAFEGLSDQEKGLTADGTRIIASPQSKEADKYNQALSAKARIRERANETAALLRSKFRLGSSPQGVVVGDSTTGVAGLIVDVRHTWKESKTSMGNPFSPSSFQVKVMLASSQNQVTMPLSAMDRVFANSARVSNLERVFNFTGASEEMARESRYIVTGNLIRAYTELNRSGDIIRFTTENGETEEGILLPQDFNPSTDVKLDAKLENPERAAAFLRDYSYDSDVRRFGISTRDGTLRATPGDSLGGVTLTVAGSAAKGGKWWQNDDLVELIGRDFAGSRSTKSAEVTPDKALAVMEFIYRQQPLYALPSMAHLIEGYAARNSGASNPSAFFARAKEKKPPKQQESQKRQKSGMKKKRIDDALEKVKSNWKNAPDIEVVQSIDDLPEDMRKVIYDADAEFARQYPGESPEPVEGMFDIRRQKVWIVADEVVSVQRAQKVLIHEALGHYGLRQVFGRDLKAVLNQVYWSQKKLIQQKAKEYGLDLDTERGRMIAAEEVLAHMAEGDINQNLVQRAIAAIKEWLRKQGFDISLSDNDIKRLLRAAADAVVSGESQSSAVMGTTNMASRSAPIFHSQLERALEEKLPNKGPAQQMRINVNGLMKSGAFKREELEWIGLNEWFDEQKGTVTKDQVLDFVKQTKVQINEILKSENSGGEVTSQAKIEQEKGVVERSNGVLSLTVDNDGFYSGFLMKAPDSDSIDHWRFWNSIDENGLMNEDGTFDEGMFRELQETYVIRPEIIQVMKDLIRDVASYALNDSMGYNDMVGAQYGPSSAYSDLNLPGGENYHELLLTIPSAAKPVFTIHRNGDPALRAVPDSFGTRAEAEAALAGMKRPDLFYVKESIEDRLLDFASPHWREKNVIAHVRFDDRVDDQGRRVLFLEEVQSDWHQEGRKSGYEGDMLGVIEETEKQIAELERTREEALENGDNELFHKTRSDISELRAQLVFLNTRKSAPDAPLKESKSWSLLVMKRMIRYAVDHGYDRIAWTTGDQQAERYNKLIAHNLNKIEVEYIGKYYYRVTGYVKNEQGQLLNATGVEVHEERLSDHIGNQMAEKVYEKVVENSYNKTKVDFEGDDLSIGGHGMRGFYDKILVSAVNKYVKKWGAKAGTTKINTRKVAGVSGDMVMDELRIDGPEKREEYWGSLTPEERDRLIAEYRAKTETVHAIDVTDKMREAAAESQPLFSRRSDRGDDETDPNVRSLLNKIGQPGDMNVADRIRYGLRPGLMGRLESMWDRFNQGSVDQFRSLLLAERRQAASRGEEWDADRSSYIAARMSTSLDSQLMVALVKGPLRWIGNRATFVHGQKGLLEILQRVEGRIELWEAYMVARRADRLMAEGKERLLTPDEIRAGLALADTFPEFEVAAEEWSRFNKTMLDFAEDSGLIDPDKRAIWEHDDYIPFYRILNDDMAKGPRGRKGISHQTAGIRQLFGGESNLNDILENMVMNTSHLLSSAMKNHAMLMAVDNLSGTGLMRHAGMKFNKELIPMSQFKKILKDETDIDVDDLPDSVVKGIRDLWAMKVPTDKNVVRVMRDGKAEYYYVDDPMLLNAMTSIDQVAWGEWMEIFRLPKRWLTNMVTADPAFMAANFIRDTMQAFVLSRDNVTPLLSGIKGARRALQKSDSYWEMLAAGGGFHAGFVNAHDPSASAKIVKAEMRHKDFKKSLIDSPLKMWDRWQEFGSAVENANRIAVYEGAIEANKSRLMAAYEAKDFMDFSMRGDFAIFNFLAQTVPFFNARLQGIYRLGRGIKEDPGAFAVKGMLLTLASLALWYKNRDDDRYRDLQEWDKDTYWHFWYGEDHWRFPKPFETGFVFGTMPERIAGAIHENEDPAGQVIFDRFLWNLREVFNLGVLPQTVAPIAEQVANKDFFREAPIVGMAMENLEPEYQYNPWTHETSIKVGQMLGISPARVDHAVTGYFGTISDYALSASDMMIRQLWDFPDAPETRMQDVPVIKRFYRGKGEREGTKYSSEFYELIRDLEKTHNTIRSLSTYGQTEEAKARYEDRKEELKPLPMLKKARSALGKIRKNVEYIHRSEDMTPAEKNARLDELVQKKNAIYKDAVTRAKKASREK